MSKRPEDRRAVHLIDPDTFVRSGRERAWCGSFGSKFSPKVEHPDDADCRRCLARVGPWHRRMDRETS